jgi:hypothetical protein
MTEANLPFHPLSGPESVPPVITQLLAQRFQDKRMSYSDIRGTLHLMW